VCRVKSVPRENNAARKLCRAIRAENADELRQRMANAIADLKIRSQI
jgi:hypothetical protein